jgi:hypothetical protein
MAATAMKADLRIWVEAGIAYHLKRGLPIEDLPRTMVGRVLAQLLYHFRCDVPDEWADAVSELDFSVLARGMETSPAIDTEFREFTSFAAEVQAALEKGDWQSLRSVPDGAWQWITRTTGLDEADWESIPSLVRAALDSRFVCPVCKHTSRLAESAKVAYSMDPFDWGSSNATHLTCRRCGAHLVYDVATGTAKPWGQTWSRVRTVVFALMGLGVLLLFLATVWRSMG